MTPAVPHHAAIVLISAFLLSIVPARADTGPLPDGWRLPAAEQLGGIVIARLPLPDGWRLPATGEMDARWRDDDPGRYLYATADLNGDGVSDSALVLVSEKPGPRGRPSAIGAFAFLSQPGGGRRSQPVHILEHPLPVDFRQFGIAARPPGRYVTACGAGYGDGCAPGEPDAVDLKHDGIECGLFESVTGLFWWNAAAGRFEGVPVSD